MAITTTANEIDAGGRTILGRLARAGTYRATVREAGTMLLEPARLVTDAELAVLANPEVAQRIARVLDHPETAVTWDRRA